MASQQEMEALLQHMRQMSAADLSVLHASVHTPGSFMTTSPGSPNQLFWSAMEKLGWMIRTEDDLGLAGGGRFSLQMFAATPEGCAAIGDLLAALARTAVG
jgi:hypothetical protein